MSRPHVAVAVAQHASGVRTGSVPAAEGSPWPPLAVVTGEVVRAGALAPQPALQAAPLTPTPTAAAASMFWLLDTKRCHDRLPDHHRCWRQPHGPRRKRTSASDAPECARPVRLELARRASWLAHGAGLGCVGARGAACLARRGHWFDELAPSFLGHRVPSLARGARLHGHRCVAGCLSGPRRYRRPPRRPPLCRRGSSATAAAIGRVASDFAGGVAAGGGAHAGQRRPGVDAKHSRGWGTSAECALSCRDMSWLRIAQALVKPGPVVSEA